MNEDDENVSIYSISDYSSVEIRNGRSDLFKNKSDIIGKEYNRVLRKKNHKMIPIYFYTTRYTPGSKIRNAVSGFGDKTIVVGRAKDEYSFFKVGFATGELGKEPYGTHLYYDSPEQYEKHFNTTIQDKIKDAWWVRYRLNQKIMDSEIERHEHTIIH